MFNRYRSTTIDFPASKINVIKWASSEGVSFDNDNNPTHAAPNGWAWYKVENGTWFLVRIKPQGPINLYNRNTVVSQVDVLRHEASRENVFDLHKKATKATVSYIKRTRKH